MKKLLFAAALAVAAVTARAEVEQAEPTPVKLLGVVFDDRGITFQIDGNPCRTDEDLAFQLLESDPVQLVVLEKQPQGVCNTLVWWPYGTQHTFSYEQLGLKGGRFTINNPINPGVIHTRNF